jgi:hypothetical protein
MNDNLLIYIEKYIFRNINNEVIIYATVSKYENMSKPIIKGHNELILCYFLFYINNVYSSFGIKFIKV